MKITPEYIKNLVENRSGIKDLETRSRKRYLVDTRYVCYKLCKDFIPKRRCTLESIGAAFLRDHSTILHGLKEFEYLFDNATFVNSKSLYLSVKAELMKSNIIESDEDLLNELTLQELKQNYKTKHILHMNKSHEVINVLNKRIETMKNNLPVYYGSESLQRLSELNYRDFKEFEKRADMYIKSLNWKSGLRLNKVN